jgi:hypothetical protein
MGLIIRQAVPGPIDCDEADVQPDECLLKRGALQARASGAMEMEDRMAGGLTELGKAEAPAVLQNKGLVQSVGRHIWSLRVSSRTRQRKVILTGVGNY